MDDRKKKSFDFAAESSKQMITLATGIIALTVVFLDDVLSGPSEYLWLLHIAWLCFVGVIVFGLWFTLSLTGILGSAKVTGTDLTIYKSNARWPMGLQILCFLAGIGFTVAFGWVQL